MVIATGAGFEQRNQQWSRPRRQGELSVTLYSEALLREFEAFFEARGGRLRGFRLKDQKDYLAVDEPLDHDEATEVQLTKTYTSGGVTRVRPIYKPITGTVTLKKNGVAYTSFLVDYNSGTVYLGAALAGGDTLTWSGEYHVPVRFDTDLQELTHHAPTFSEWTSIPIVELRGVPAAVAPAIDPLTLANLELYLRADQVAGANGAAVSTWNDLSPNNWDAAQANAALQPTVLTPGSANGTRLVRFDGVTSPNGDTMGFAMGGGNFPPATAGMTFYFYGVFYTQVNSFNGAVLFQDDTGGQPQLILKQAAPDAGIGWRDATTHAGSTYAPGTDVYAWVFEPPSGSGTGRVFKNGVQIHSDVWTFTTTSASSYIVSGNPSNVCVKMDLGAVVWFSEDHDAATRLGVELYLRRFFED
jgi:uncharacterized protein (TIGR02217 family)